MLGEACSERRIGLLTELRFVTKEVGSLSEARSMPTEIRRWWIDQMIKEKQQQNSNGMPPAG